MPQATEFIDKYDPELIWYDGDMSSASAEELGTYDIAAYFYNQSAGRKEVAINDRYGVQDNKWLRSRRGDFFTNEYGDMEKEAKQTTRAWEACWGISQSFGYNWQDTDENVISSKEFIDKFVDIVAHGGNLLLIVNLDGHGALPTIQENRLKDIGKWLKVNGEGIYSTRPFTPQVDGPVAFTRSKDNHYVYAIMKEWPGQQLQLKGIQAARDSKIQLLGYGKPLEWVNSEGGTLVKLPNQLQDASNRPCEHAWVLKIEL
jgi:alpha-L-fucosidase